MSQKEVPKRSLIGSHVYSFDERMRPTRAWASLVSIGKRLVRNFLLDLKYGDFLGGTLKTPYAHLGIVDTANTDYAALPFVFGDRLQPSDVLVDIGCGKGRVINWWLSRELGNRIVGVEVNKAVAQMTQRRLKRHKNVKIVCGDALKNLPEDGTIFYLFNPFDRPWVAALKDRLAILFGSGERRTIFYYNCVHADVFKEDPDWIVEEVVPEPSSRFHPVAIIRKRNRNPEPGPSHDDPRGY